MATNPRTSDSADAVSGYDILMSYVSHKWNLWKFRRKRRAIQKVFAKKFETYRQDNSKSSWDYAELQADEHFEGEMMEEAINASLSSRLIDQAIECDVEVPSPSDNKELWQYTDDGENCYLNAKGRALMRDLVQKEKDRNFDDWARWAKTFAPIIAALAALFGAATGLVLALKK